MNDELGSISSSSSSSDDEPPIATVAHPFKVFRRPEYRGKKKAMKVEDQLELCMSYLQSAQVFCKRWSRANKKLGLSHYTKCDCISFFRLQSKADEREAVARYMMYYYNKKRPDQQQILMDWIRYSNHKSSTRRFFLPFSKRNETAMESEDRDDPFGFTYRMAKMKGIKVCRSAIGFILDESKHSWQTCSKLVDTNTLPAHGNKSRRSGRAIQFDANVRADLGEYFTDLQKLAEPRSTRVIRQEVGAITLRDCEDDAIYLPPYMAKRKLYEDFCADRGYALKDSPKGYSKTKNRDDAESIPSWYGFRSFWKREFPKLRLGRSTEDVCTECHNYHNMFRFAMTRREQAAAESEESEEELSDKELGLSYYYTPEKNKPKTKDAAGEEAVNYDMDYIRNVHMDAVPAADEISKLMVKAALHVERAKDQRRLCNERIGEAEIDFAAQVPHEEARRCLVVDYCQNVDMPQLGANQPGKTYYLSPLRVFVFGIVNCGLPGGTLDAYIYHEGEGMKGGNNVASMIMLFLEKQGWLSSETCGGQLTIIMDNCSGQNKNNTVLRLAVYLVKAGYFNSACCMFYIVGHTKNACDRWFNTMKKVYRKTDIYSMTELKKALKAHERISVTTQSS
jgi:hypothetical protein